MDAKRWTQGKPEFKTLECAKAWSYRGMPFLTDEEWREHKLCPKF
jgi:hypothetical protein